MATNTIPDSPLLEAPSALQEQVRLLVRAADDVTVLTDVGRRQLADPGEPIYLAALSIADLRYLDRLLERAYLVADDRAFAAGRDTSLDPTKLTIVRINARLRNSIQVREAFQPDAVAKG